MNMHSKYFLAVLATGVVLASVACGPVNQPIIIGEGETISGDQVSVNGRIEVGSNARVEGNLTTVNGSVEIGENSHVQEVETVNGSITLASAVQASTLQTTNGAIELGQDVRINGHVMSTNGSVTVAEGSEVDGNVRTVNGLIHLTGATVNSVENINGGMVLDQGCHVRGELKVGRVERERNRIPEIVIGPDCQVDGPLIFERDVSLRVHESARIGQVEGAEVQRFDGPIDP